MSGTLNTYQIREGVVVISWEFNLSRCREASSTSINTGYRVQCSHTGESAELLVTIDTDDGIDPAENVLAILNGVAKSMTATSKERTWTASFGIDPYFRNKYIRIEFVIDSNPVFTKALIHVLKNVSNLWETKAHADIIFEIESTTIPAHTEIVSSGSQVLAAMIQGNFRERANRVAVIRDVKANVFEKLLRFIYTGDAQIDEATAIDLLIAADLYQMELLKNDCGIYMPKNLTVENATQYLILSHLHKVDNLYQATLDFMVKNGPAICSRKECLEPIKNYPELSFAAMQRILMRGAPVTVDKSMTSSKDYANLFKNC